MQLAVTAFAPVRCRVSNIFTTVRPRGAVSLGAEQCQKILAAGGIPHTLVDHAHEFKFPTLAFGCRVVFRIGHSARLPLLIFLEFRQSQFFTDLVVANAQRLNLLIRHMHFFTGFKIDAVDNTV